MVNHMLVPLDGCRLAECVLPHAVALARALDAQVTVLRAVDRGSSGTESEPITPLRWHMLRSEAKTYLSDVASRLREAGVEADWTLVEGAPAERIIAFADAEEVDLVLLSSHGRSGLTGWNVGSVVQKVAMRCYTATMIVQAYRAPCRDLTSLRYEQILIPLDGSRRAECVLPLAMRLAEFCRCRLLLAHIVSPPEMPRRVPLTEEELALRDQVLEVNRRAGRDYLERLASLLPADVETRLLVNDHPVNVLHELTRQEAVDLVVLGAHGYSGTVRRPYGRTALDFIAYGTLPLIVVQDLSRQDAEMTAAERAASEGRGQVVDEAMSAGALKSKFSSPSHRASGPHSKRLAQRAGRDASGSRCELDKEVDGCSRGFCWQRTVRTTPSAHWNMPAIWRSAMAPR